MTVQELLRRQQDLAPKVDLAQYSGEWVVLRDGHVVSHGADPVALSEDENVREGDAIIPVIVSESRIVV